MNNNKNHPKFNHIRSEKNGSIPQQAVEKLVKNMQDCLGPLAKPPRLKVAKTHDHKSNAISQPTPWDQMNNLTAILIKEYQGLKNKYLATLANYENYRKQTAKEQQEHQQYASADLATALLPIIDSFERALQIKTVDQALKNFLIGFNMIYKNLKSELTSIGVELITVKPGDIFNHNLHHAIANEVTTLFPAGYIIKIVSAGYRLHQRILRHTEVIVAKAPVKHKPPIKTTVATHTPDHDPPGNKNH